MAAPVEIPLRDTDEVKDFFKRKINFRFQNNRKNAIKTLNRTSTTNIKLKSATNSYKSLEPKQFRDLLMKILQNIPLRLFFDIFSELF
jgi:hypothetical protein